MPILSRWHVKLSFIYFITGLVIGGLMMTGKWIEVPRWVWLLRQTHVHLLTFGWITQLIFGIAYWMLPRLTKYEPRGNELVNWLVFITFNLGLLMRIVFEPLHFDGPTPTLGLLLTISGWLQVTAGILFVINAWRRVRTMQSKKRR
jgi:heme/copper-type cytochrome/quinol oxidase subunit 1